MFRKNTRSKPPKRENEHGGILLFISHVPHHSEFLIVPPAFSDHSLKPLFNGMASNQKPPDEFQLMMQIFDNLQYLDYETEYDPVSHHFPFLNPVYFAMPGQSTKEQFDYFAGLSIWVMQTFLGSTIETPSDFDEPATVADNLILALPQIGFKLSFASSKLVPGHGLAVCTILDALLRQAIKKKHFQTNSFRPVSGLGGSEEIETVGIDDDDGIVEEALDMGDDDEVEVVQGAVEYGTDKVIDSLELKKEAERVAPRLQIRIPAAKSDWRSHFQMMNQHHGKVTELMTQLAPILSKVG
jgi:hypothetical protein